MKEVYYLLFLIPFQFLYTQNQFPIEYSKLSDILSINHTDTSLADGLFNFVISEMDFIDFDDCNNCDIRAHLITLVIEKRFENVKIGKAWIFSDSKRVSKKEFYKKSGHSSLTLNAKCLNWSFHVAPVIITNKDTMIIDPSTQNRAVKLHKWYKDLIPSGSSALLVIKQPQYFFFPQDDSQKFNDLSSNWGLFTEKSSTEEDIQLIAEKITLAYIGFFEPARFYYYKNKILDLYEK